MPLAPIGPLRTERLVVRAAAEGDLADLLAVNGDPEVTRFLPYATWRSLEDARAWLERMENVTATGTAHQLVVARHADGRVIGTVLVFKYDEASARAELGYVLGREHWGRGLMHEALRALCGHLFAEAGLRRLEAEVDPRNAASDALLARLGFVREGRLRERWVAKGAAYDTHIYGLLAAEWGAGR